MQSTIKINDIIIRLPSSEHNYFNPTCAFGAAGDGAVLGLSEEKSGHLLLPHDREGNIAVLPGQAYTLTTIFSTATSMVASREADVDASETMPMSRLGHGYSSVADVASTARAVKPSAAELSGAGREVNERAENDNKSRQERKRVRRATAEADTVAAVDMRHSDHPVPVRQDTSVAKTAVARKKTSAAMNDANGAANVVTGKTHSAAAREPPSHATNTTVHSALRGQTHIDDSEDQPLALSYATLTSSRRSRKSAAGVTEGGQDVLRAVHRDIPETLDGAALPRRGSAEGTRGSQARSRPVVSPQQPSTEVHKNSEAASPLIGNVGGKIVERSSITAVSRSPRPRPVDSGAATHGTHVTSHSTAHTATPRHRASVLQDISSESE